MENNSLHNSLYDGLLFSFECQSRALDNVVEKLKQHLSDDQFKELKNLIKHLHGLNVSKAEIYNEIPEEHINASFRKVAHNMFKYEFLNGDVKIYIKLGQYGLSDKIIREALGY